MSGGCYSSLLQCQLGLLAIAFIRGFSTWPGLAQSMVVSGWLDFLPDEVAPKVNVPEELGRASFDLASKVTQFHLFSFLMVISH